MCKREADKMKYMHKIFPLADCQKHKSYSGCEERKLDNSPGDQLPICK